MYAYISGRVAEKGSGELIIETGGVGYALQCSMTTLSQAPATGENMRCYTYLSVREDAMDLFGFATKEEKAMFLRLTSVSGIGPRTALGVLGSMPLKDLHLAILTGDLNALSRAPGVGKKTAQRITLELKDQITQEAMTGLPPEQTVGGSLLFATMPLPKPCKPCNPWVIPPWRPLAPCRPCAVNPTRPTN
jgi:Holliday junction DNA helicase RuvA